MKVTEIISEAKKSEAPKPRNFVAKHAKTGGAGAHKDKKKAMKQGDVKHKAKAVAEGTMDYSIDPSITDFASISIIKKLKRDVHDKRLPADPKEIMRAGAELARYYKTELNLPLLAKQVLSGYTKGVAEAGFVDVTGWSPSQVQAMGRADDDGIGYYSNRNKPNLIAWVFYNVKPGQEDQAATLNIRKLKSGKWAMPVYDKSGATYRFQRNKADQVFGPGKRWDIKKEQSNVAETATAGGTSAGMVSVGAVYKNKPGKTPKNKDGTAKNALDMKANLLTGGSVKR